MSATNEFEQLLVSKLPLLKRYALTIARTARDNDDLIQDTITIAWSKEKEFIPGTNFNAWLFTIMKRCHSNTIGRDITRQNYQNGYHGTAEAELPEQEDYLAYQDAKQIIERLPIEQRAALFLICEGERSYKEAAEILECSIGTVKSRVSRARAEIARVWDTNPLDRNDREQLKQGL